MIEGSKGHSNAQSLFGVHQISDNQIRDLLDSVKPEQVFLIFEEILQVLEKQGQLKGLRSFADSLLIAMDGTEYFSSSQTHCPHCSTRQLKSGEMHYFHSVVTPAIVCPGQSQVLSLVPEFVVPQDGYDKQDCENAAAKVAFALRIITLQCSRCDGFGRRPLLSSALMPTTFSATVQLHFEVPTGARHAL